MGHRAGDRVPLLDRIRFHKSVLSVRELPTPPDDVDTNTNQTCQESAGQRKECAESGC